MKPRVRNATPKADYGIRLHESSVLQSRHRRVAQLQHSVSSLREVPPAVGA